MTRRYTPTGDLLATVLAGRVDALENDLRQITGDVAAVGRGVTDLTIQIRHLTPNLGSTDAADDAAADAAAPVGQIDWFAADPEGQAFAVDLLHDLIAWAESVGSWYGIDLAPPCWALHPTVVADLVALLAERDAAYANTKPTPVSEFLTRWLPATRDRIRDALGPCAAERGHRHDGRTYDITGFDQLSAATWWATDRATPAVQAFALPELT
jgi:hypothetical protein